MEANATSRTHFTVRFPFWASATPPRSTIIFIKSRSSNAASYRSSTSTINRNSRASSTKWWIQNGESKFLSITLFISVGHDSRKCVCWPEKVKISICAKHVMVKWVARGNWLIARCWKADNKFLLRWLNVRFWFRYRFKTNALKLRNLISDQPIGNSVERATWWINYVIRNGGTVSWP